MGTKRQTIMQKHQQRWDCETSSASGLLRSVGTRRCLSGPQPGRTGWWPSSLARLLAAGLRQGTLLFTLYLRFRIPGRGSGWGGVGGSPIVVPTWRLGLQSVGPKLCRNQSPEQIPDGGKTRMGASVSPMRLRLVLGLGRGREQGKEECSWLWVFLLTS